MEWWVILGRAAMPAISLKATPQQLILSGFSATTIEIFFWDSRCILIHQWRQLQQYRRYVEPRCRLFEWAITR